jgi:tetratricopeptide (TPR) repeat protein
MRNDVKQNLPEARRFFLLALISIIAVAVVVSGCNTPESPENAAETEEKYTGKNDAFAEAFSGERYSEALLIAEERLKKDPENGMLLINRGEALCMLKRYEEAVESFRNGQICSPNGFLDKTALYLRAQALFEIKAFSRTQEELDALSAKFPHSKTAALGQELALAVEKRLAEGVGSANLNWYFNAGKKAYDDGKAALASEYMEEYFLLSKRLASIPTEQKQEAGYIAGAVFLELGDAAKSVEFLSNIPAEYSDYRAATMLAIALRANGKNDHAVEVIAEAAQKTLDDDVKQRAEKYLSAWKAE